MSLKRGLCWGDGSVRSDNHLRVVVHVTLGVVGCGYVIAVACVSCQTEINENCWMRKK